MCAGALQRCKLAARRTRRCRAVPAAWHNAPALALPDCRTDAVHIVDNRRWTLMATIEPPGTDAQQAGILAAAAAAAQPCPRRPGP